MYDEFQLDECIVSGAFDDTFDIGLVGTTFGTIWFINWKTNRSKSCLITSHSCSITALLSIDDNHVVTSSNDDTLRLFRLDDRTEIRRMSTNGPVSTFIDRSFRRVSVI
jgi:WD repeat-containing protein 90